MFKTVHEIFEFIRFFLNVIKTYGKVCITL